MIVLPPLMNHPLRRPGLDVRERGVYNKARILATGKKKKAFGIVHHIGGRITIVDYPITVIGTEPA